MKDEKLLKNQSVENFGNTEKELKNEIINDNEILKGQIKLGLNEVNLPEQIYLDAKYKIKERARILEISGIWKNPAIPFSITSIIATFFIIFLGSIIQFNQIPPRIPFVYNANGNHWEQVDKLFLFIFPIIFLLVQFIIINIAIKLFYTDRKLSISIAWIVFFINIMLIIAVGQIYTLIT